MKPELKKDLSNLKEYLKEMVGVNIEMCDHFTGIRNNSKGNYVNIVFKNQLWDSNEYGSLSEYIRKYKTEFSHIEPNGVRRAALFFTNK